MRQWIDRLLGGRIGPPPPSNAAAKVRESQRAIAAAAASYRNLKQSVAQLHRAARDQAAAYEQAAQYYVDRAREMQTCEREIDRVLQLGDRAAAKTVMARLRQLDEQLPQLKQMVETAERQVDAVRQTLDLQQSKLTAWHKQLQQLRHLHAFNRAEAARLDSQSALQAACEQFDTARATLDRHQLELQAIEQLSRDKTAWLETQLEQLEIARALELRQQLPRNEATGS
ncbi:hypothetical protein [Synechococcus sp. PCC 7336]|uniref:hypothetical protein n=1 Tax=Synechococcus sp. PCC 7336 TaxID=195250 RepID=UPI000347C842|nr:hypothetical protein [Synechococcus sp. PCC 7336]